LPGQNGLSCRSTFFRRTIDDAGGSLEDIVATRASGDLGHPVSSYSPALKLSRRHDRQVSNVHAWAIQGQSEWRVTTTLIE